MLTHQSPSTCYRPRTTAAVVAVLLITSVGCRSKETENAPVVEKKERLQAVAPGIMVNGEMLPETQISYDTEFLSIPGLPPVSEWGTLVVRNVEGREFRASKPVLLTGIRTMKLVRTPDGKFEFRVMDKKDGGEFIRHRMPMVELIEIHKHGYTPASAKPPRLLLTRKGKSTEVNETMLSAMEQKLEPGSDKKRESWLLVDIVGVKRLGRDETIVLRGPKGKEIVLSSKDFSQKEKQHFIKRNRRGQFHYRSWSLEDSPTQVGGLRNITSIELK